MKLREYLPSKDFDNIKSWIDDERTHAMWCAGRFEYPLEKENFEAVLEDMHSKWGDTPFIASLDDGNNAGFFCYSLNDETKRRHAEVYCGQFIAAWKRCCKGNA